MILRLTTKVWEESQLKRALVTQNHSLREDLELHDEDKGHKTKELMAHLGCMTKKDGPTKLMNSEKLLKGMNFPATT